MTEFRESVLNFVLYETTVSVLGVPIIDETNCILLHNHFPSIVDCGMFHNHFPSSSHKSSGASGATIYS